MYYIGLDLGLTVIKGIVFDFEGREIARSSIKPVILNPEENYFERDCYNLWDCVKTVLNELTFQVNSNEIEAISLSGYGDGLYLLDKDKNLLDNGILSYDKRADPIIDAWEIDGKNIEALRKIGQKVFPAMPVSLLYWYKRNRPDIYKGINHILFCKDFIRYKLTGNICTDYSDASAGFTDVFKQDYSEDILEFFDISEIRKALPPIKCSYEVGGFVTDESSKLTGLKIGTPVAVGAHDIDACAVGVGAIENNVLCMIAGTWCINEIVNTIPQIDKRWMCRNFVEKGQWLHQSSSPASSINLDWYIKNYLFTKDNKIDDTFYKILEENVKNINTKVIFLPFLFGSPYNKATGTFIGIKGDYKKNNLLRAIYEGVVFNHKYHIEALNSSFNIEKIRFTGGASKSYFWAQLFSDIINKNIETVKNQEAGCFGNALLAMIMTDKLKSLEDTLHIISVKEQFKPKKDYTNKYKIYRKCCESLLDVWELLDSLEM